MNQRRRTFIKSVCAVASSLAATNVAAATPGKKRGIKWNRHLEEHSVSENEVKHAQGKLPNYLSGTKIDGSAKVLATESGSREEPHKNVEVDEIITLDDVSEIERHAINDYVDDYGVDPSNIAVDIIDGKPLPVEHVREKVASGQIKLGPEKEVSSTQELSVSQSGTSLGPSAINNTIHLTICPAEDSGHFPSESYYSATTDAWNRFSAEFGIDARQSVAYGYWDASDVGNNMSNVLNDLQADTQGFRTADNQIVLGWIDLGSKNGNAYTDGYHSVAACKAYLSPDWPHDSLAQHEISHNFNAQDGGTLKFEHSEECIMNYEWAHEGTDKWGTEDSNIIVSNIYEY